MKNIFSFTVLFYLVIFAKASSPDSTAANEQASVMVIPYEKAMHLSDADPDISEGSEMDMDKMRETLRQGLLKTLNKKFAEVYNVRGMKNDFVKESDRDMDILYHSLLFEGDTVYPLKYPSRFAIKDTTQKKKDSPSSKPETKYINVGVYDSMLIPDYSKKYNADYLIFLNEIDIKTHFDDCINLAMKIYRRDIMVHYSIFDRNGKQIYGDVAVSHFASNSNDVNDIIDKNFPGISNYILASFNRAVNQ